MTRPYGLSPEIPDFLIDTFLFLCYNSKDKCGRCRNQIGKIGSHMHVRLAAISGRAFFKAKKGVYHERTDQGCVLSRVPGFLFF